MEGGDDQQVTIQGDLEVKSRAVQSMEAGGLASCHNNNRKCHALSPEEASVLVLCKIPQPRGGLFSGTLTNRGSAAGAGGLLVPTVDSSQ